MVASKPLLYRETHIVESRGALKVRKYKDLEYIRMPVMAITLSTLFVTACEKL